MACEMVRNGVHRQDRARRVQLRRSAHPLRPARGAMEPGLDWDFWLGPAPKRPYNSILSPRGMHKHFPTWRSTASSAAAAVCDWGAHHLDIAQWGLGMDDSGPVEVLPPKKPGDKRGVKLVYANGVTVEHKERFRRAFLRHRRRGPGQPRPVHLQACGKMIATYAERKTRRPPAPRRCRRPNGHSCKDAKIQLYVSKNHISDFMECVTTSQEADHQRAGRRPLGHLLPPDEPGLLPRPEDQVGPGEVHVRRRHRRSKWLTRDYRSPWTV